MSLGGAPHRLAIGFLQGGLIAILAMALLPACITVAIGIWPESRSLPSMFAPFYAPLGLALGGLVAGASVEQQPRGRLGIGAAFLIAGVVLAWPLAMLRGLTGFEPLAAVLPFAVFALSVAFGAAGVVGGWTLALPVRSIVRVAARAAAGGGCAGMLMVVPLLLRKAGSDAAVSGVMVFVSLACSSLAVLVPLVVTGHACGQALEQMMETRSGAR